MPVITLQNFSGMMPLRDDLLLPDNYAQYSENTWLYKGSIRGFRHAINVYTLKHSDTKQIYRIPETDDQPPDYIHSLWLEFPDPFMASLRNPVVGDKWNRFYFFPSEKYNSNGSNPDWPITKPVAQYRTYDPTTKTLGPLLTLGIPTPANAPTVVNPPIEITATATQKSGPGITSIVIDNTTNITKGMTITDTTDTKITGTVVTSSTLQGNKTINIDNTSNIYPGMLVTDTTTPGNIASYTTVAWVSATQVGITTGVVNDLPVGNKLQFENVNQIPGGTSVTSIDAAHNSVLMSAGTVMAGVLVGDSIKFDVNASEERAYIYTYVSAYGEEGPASQPTVAGPGDPTGVWEVTIPAPDPSATVHRNLTKVRLYRTITDSAGNATYYQVKEFDWSSSAISYSDSATSASIVNNNQLTTELYTPPPADLQGVVMMANGIMAGWSNEREVWFSAAYLPHAWPASFALTVDYPIVGMTANGASLNIMCKGSPFIATGVTPDTMTIGKVTANEPCVGRGSVVSSGEGAYYASPNGIILLNSSGTQNITSMIYEKEFHNYLNPYEWAAGKYGLAYVAFIKGGVPNLDPDGDIVDGFVIDHEDRNVSFSYLCFKNRVSNLYWDEISGQLFGILTNGSVMQWNPPVPQPDTTTLWKWEWRSKQFRMNFPLELKAFECVFEVPPEVNITLGKRNNDQNQVFDQSSQYLLVRIYADDRLVVVREVQKNFETILIPGGYKATLFEFELEGQVITKLFKIATSVKELRKG